MATNTPAKPASPFKPSIRLKAFTTPDAAISVKIIPNNPKEKNVSIIGIPTLDPNFKEPNHQTLKKTMPEDAYWG